RAAGGSSSVTELDREHRARNLSRASMEVHHRLTNLRPSKCKRDPSANRTPSRIHLKMVLGFVGRPPRNEGMRLAASAKPINDSFKRGFFVSENAATVAMR